jgi:hypothetical protein
MEKLDSLMDLHEKIEETHKEIEQAINEVKGNFVQAAVEVFEKTPEVIISCDHEEQSVDRLVKLPLTEIRMNDFLSFAEKVEIEPELFDILAGDNSITLSCGYSW